MAKTNEPKGGKMKPIPRGATLKEEDKKKLAEHAGKHDKGHISSMRMHMLKGVSFDEAHKKATNRVVKPKKPKKP
tara:strand:+ start:7182 stop:7406 length:225 start_codon:yes stop_codon:yes gene_type:complete